MYSLRCSHSGSSDAKRLSALPLSMINDVWIRISTLLRSEWHTWQDVTAVSKCHLSPDRGSVHLAWSIPPVQTRIAYSASKQLVCSISPSQGLALQTLQHDSWWSGLVSDNSHTDFVYFPPFFPHAVLSAHIPQCFSDDLCCDIETVHYIAEICLALCKANQSHITLRIRRPLRPLCDIRL